MDGDRIKKRRTLGVSKKDTESPTRAEGVRQMNSNTESLATPATTPRLATPAPALQNALTASRDVLTEVLRGGAQQLLAQAVEAEVVDWIESHKHHVDETGDR